VRGEAYEPCCAIKNMPEYFENRFPYCTFVLTKQVTSTKPSTMKNNFYCLGAFAIFLFLFSISPAQAQCSGFTKKSSDLLTPYDISGKAHKVVLQSGDHAELSFTFFSGQSYRIIMNSSDAANGIVFILKDAQNKMIYTSAADPNRLFYDFTSESTQQLTVEMIAPELAWDPNTISSNCVSVMVGSKPPL